MLDVFGVPQFWPCSGFRSSRRHAASSNECSAGDRNISCTPRCRDSPTEQRMCSRSPTKTRHFVRVLLHIVRTTTRATGVTQFWTCSGFRSSRRHAASSNECSAGDRNISCTPRCRDSPTEQRMCSRSPTKTRHFVRVLLHIVRTTTRGNVPVPQPSYAAQPYNPVERETHGNNARKPPNSLRRAALQSRRKRNAREQRKARKPSNSLHRPVLQSR